MLKAILFDFDDTLIDWSGFNGEWRVHERQRVRGVFDHIVSLNGNSHSFADFDTFFDKYMVQTRDAWIDGRSTLRAPHLGQIILATATECGLPDDMLDIATCLRTYDWQIIEGTHVFPDVPEALALFRSHGLKTCIVTNASQPISVRDREIEQHGLLDYFPDCRLAAADAGYLKPHPAIFKHALDCIGITPDEAVFVGDNPAADIAGAQGVGMKAVLRVKTPAQPLLSGLIIPDAAINSLLDLPSILDAWYPDWRT